MFPANSFNRREDNILIDITVKAHRIDQNVLKAIKLAFNNRIELTEDQLVYKISEILLNENTPYNEDEILAIIEDLGEKGFLVKFGLKNKYYYQLGLGKNKEITYKPSLTSPEVEMTWSCRITSTSNGNDQIFHKKDEIIEKLKKAGFEIKNSNFDSLPYKIDLIHLNSTLVFLKIDFPSAIITSRAKTSELPVIRNNIQPTTIEEFRNLNLLRFDHQMVVLSANLSANFEVFRALSNCLDDSTISINLNYWDLIGS